jgi:two-component system sensor histidine kinase/response regulator
MTKVLIIEDEANIRDSIIDTLEFANYELASARNGREGVKIAQSFEPDIILCDVMMPEMDGYGVLLELNQDYKLSQVPFIFLTAKATKEDVRKGMVMGADDYLTKPFTAQELLDAVQSRLERHQQVKQYNVEHMELIRRYINLTLPHELRTPMTGIMGYLYILEDGLEDMDKEMTRSMILAIKRSSTRLMNLIENYVAYGQLNLLTHEPEIIEKLRQHSTLKSVDGLIVQVAEKLAYDFDRIGDIEIDLDSANVHIFPDYGTKLFESIISNAFKFSPKGSPVHLIGRVDANHYILAVTNEGRGMTTEQIAKIRSNEQFEREKYEQQGVGLGLSIAQAILKIFDGELQIESQVNHLTTVYIRLSLV